jgi:hypothetical protein
MRPHSTAAVVLSRPDAPLGSGPPAQEQPPSTVTRIWPTLLTWVLLGAAIAALWALLLLGDSLLVGG